LTTFEVVLKQWSEWVRTANSFNAKLSGSLPGQLPIRGYYPLMLTHYGLVIVDEIGRLGNPIAQTTKAVCALEADMRVGATGTPIQNDYDELHSIMKFLRVKPWAKPSTFSKVSN
jgi:superfamily II DNA or RNA helicase